MDVIVGTAGHIDHGKTALVKALTGVDADRLPEEKQRGITIDLGFAEMRSDEVGIGFVDVPGHERFVKNMLAGASGIDLVLLVVAADEGVMPQTREHFDICRLLHIKSGLIALTKKDLVDEDMLDVARLDVEELVRGSFLDGAPIFVVSSRSGEGIDKLRSGLISAAKQIQREADNKEARLPIDRSFSVKGFGAVVTGTLASGEISDGDELELVPFARKVRVRGVQTHGKSVVSAHRGQRTAVNLGGIAHDEITRGMVLTRPGSISETQVFDAEVDVLADAPRGLRSRQRVRVHIGTAEVLARVSVLNDANLIEPGSRGLAQFRLESLVAAAYSDRFIIRSYSPQRTIAGGRVLDPLAHRHRAKDIPAVIANLQELSSDNTNKLVEVFVQILGDRGSRIEDLESRTALTRSNLQRLISDGVRDKKFVDAGGVFICKTNYERLLKSAIDSIERHHASDKLSRGMQRETLREQIFSGTPAEVFRSVLAELEKSEKIVVDGDVVKLASHETKLAPAEESAREHLRKLYFDVGFEVPKLEDALQSASAAARIDAKSTRKVFQLFLNSRELVAVTGEFYFPSDVLENLTSRLRNEAQNDPMIDVAKFKDLAGVSRKYAIPLLEYFDRTHVTRRVGDKRQIL
ncbi:MAG: selenocysteine-specific translation elongation factor [Acidobacteria bacterium]|nr:MAG: selenocysteine-specific translation elongation factor [Acidobacteriota bacterium]